MHLLFAAAYGTSSEGNQGESDPNNTTVRSIFKSPIKLIFLYYVGVTSYIHSWVQIFVGGLDASINDDMLRQVFGQFGDLVHVKIPLGKRCGFVQYVNR